MSLSSELEVLVQLHAAGNLTDAEFESAKAKLLAPSTSTPKSSTSIPSVQKNIRTKKDDNNPHPMRVVVSSMLILAAAAGLVFATMVPYKNGMPGVQGNCSGPIFEMFKQGDYNTGYIPNYKAPANPGNNKDFFAYVYTTEYWDNYCIEPGNHA